MLLTCPIECWNYFDDSLLTAFRRSESNRANRFLLPPSLHSSKLSGGSDEHDTSLVLPLQIQNRKDVNWIIVTELDRAWKCSKLPSPYFLTSTNQLCWYFWLSVEQPIRIEWLLYKHHWEFTVHKKFIQLRALWSSISRNSGVKLPSEKPS